MRGHCTNGWAHDHAGIVAAAHVHGWPQDWAACDESTSILSVGGGTARRLVLVDREDAKWLAAYFWGIHPRGIITRLGGSNSILLHRCIAHATADMVVNFRNGCREDCRKCNLQTRTRKEAAARRPAVAYCMAKSRTATGIAGVRISWFRDRHWKLRQRVIGELTIAKHRHAKGFYVSPACPLRVAIAKAADFRAALIRKFLPEYSAAASPGEYHDLPDNCTLPDWEALETA